MSRLEVKRLDSPLARNHHDSPAEDEQPREQQPQAASPRPKRRAAAQPSKPRLASVPQSLPDGEAGSSPLERLPDPPALNESLELLSTRLPISLRRSLSELTGALRTRDGERVSQKSLPEQEVLAVIIWLAGSAQDPETVARLGAALDAYRARRYAAAAEALRPPAPNGGTL
jgi:hypothetical protein